MSAEESLSMLEFANNILDEEILEVLSEGITVSKPLKPRIMVFRDNDMSECMESNVMLLHEV